MSTQTWTWVFVGGTFSLYLVVAWLSRVKDTRGFYVAGQGVPAAANGMATAADWMSAASFISMAGLISTLGYAGGQYLMGWTGGYVLLALLLAPYLRKFGSYTVPDFIGDRYPSRGNVARLVAVVCALFVSFTYVVGQMKGVGVVFSRFLEVSLPTGVFIGMVIVFVYATLGGMKGITWTQVAQFWVLITAFLIPAIAISIKLTGNSIPQIGLGSRVLDSVDPQRPYLLEKLSMLNADFGFGSYTEPFTGGNDMLNVLCVTLALMFGTAGLPHVIVRFYTVKNVKAARWSAFWALLFISMLYLTAPAVAGFARYYMVDRVEGLNGRTAETLPEWFTNWRTSGMIEWVDLNGDGRVQYTFNRTGDRLPTGLPANEVWNISAVPEGIRTEIREDPSAWVQDHGGGAEAFGELRALGAAPQPDNDIIVLATPEMANLADWIVAFVAAGGLAAALSTASGLLLVISSSIAHDLYYRVMNPAASEKQRLFVGRIVIAFAVVIAGFFGIRPPGFVGEVVALAFGLAAASFFPAIVLGIFTKRLGTVPAVTGMVVGLVFTGFYILTQRPVEILLGYADVAELLFGPRTSAIRQPWLFGIEATGIGTIGMLVNFAVTLALMPIFPAPDERVQAMVESIREPEDETQPPALATDEATAALH